MIDYIKKIQAKSEDSRKRILFFSMVFSMSIVGLIWFYSLGNRFDNNVKEQAKEDIKPFKMFSQSISNTYEDMQASIGSVNDIKDNPSEEKEIDLIPVEYQ